jgi:DNA-binding transcriptional ArsR family regulator
MLTDGQQPSTMQQNHSVQVKHLNEECEIELLQSIRSILSCCFQGIVELTQTPWTQVNNTELPSCRIEEVKKLISDEELKLTHSNVDYHLSLLSYAGMITTCSI